ncbi:cytochrome c biogenesis protein CcsA [Azorhizobium oxalatiphilum]|uniref:Cytochrome c biogenesis protein CcsA n=1 Tax=Azorhizobium oxalatiphilum TaxID=980631 RepID=A0A917CHB4_9HYPH|nr:cytochrome-c peroxidase [Azorhizobium oxalatiphilum]GGF87810.1 cytochrome c biogenesis protein CcsA [Azorhizobium oxalatiphilum]
MKSIVAGIAILLSVQAVSAADLRTDALTQFKPIPAEAPDVKGNPFTPAKVDLGRKLFFDPRLSASQALSCNSCHNLGTGGVDAGPTSVGHGWQRGPRRAPTVLNAVFNTSQFWDGRAEDLKAQAKGPMQNPIEMNATPELVLKTLKSMPAYVDAFKQAFPGESEPLSFDNVAKAIEVFEVTLITPRSRFDQFLNGDDKALSTTEKAGLRAFMDKGCSACHNGINLGGDSYQPFGVVEKPGADILPPDDHGRFAVTKTASDQYVFRVAPLRNVALRAPYFHSGQVWGLEQAVAVMATAQLGSELTPQEIKEVTAFLGTLSGEQPKIEYPILPPRTEATPKAQ